MRTLEDLSPNTFIMEYCGEVVDETMFMRRLSEYSQRHFYFMTVEKDHVRILCLEIKIIDASRKGNISRFINHSCAPNCATQKWIINGITRIGIFTLRKIPKGTELTFDYKFEFYGEPQKCLCGEPTCKGYIGKAKQIEENSDIEDDDDQGPVENRPKKKEYIPRPIDVEKVQPLLVEILQASNERKLLKYIKRFEVIKASWIMAGILEEYPGSLDITRCVLRILDKVNLGTRNPIQDAKLDEMVGNLKEHSDAIVSMLSKKLENEWSELPVTYRIPKRRKEDCKKDRVSEVKQQEVNKIGVSPSEGSERGSNGGYRRPFVKRKREEKEDYEGRRDYEIKRDYETKREYEGKRDFEGKTSRRDFEGKRDYETKREYEGRYERDYEGRNERRDYERHKDDRDYERRKYEGKDYNDYRGRKDERKYNEMERGNEKESERFKGRESFNGNDRLNGKERFKDEYSEKEKEKNKRNFDLKRDFDSRKDSEDINKFIRDIKNGKENDLSDLQEKDDLDGKKDLQEKKDEKIFSGFAEDDIMRVVKEATISRKEEKSSFKEQLFNFVIKYLSKFKDKFEKEEFKKMARKIKKKDTMKKKV
ncbi:hypothetical protein ROZALSC1DRAFT_29860 [Rozella allomycis CSF55]|uniref:SET domain-containing protein n=1 Tax=Rozella allomycis (strain CSF55) TaxID=988480 RepID=A0A4V1IZL4_ROZAC|nr:hypothetical protein ROZALSC1DRAFT_29860 [Rozella allomycis CSF55]